MKKKVSVCLKILMSFLAILGVTLACIWAVRDGYSPWYKRLWYFTLQSNLWISASSLIILFSNIIGRIKNKKIVKDYMYVLQFIFTISITITGFIFWTVVAPFVEDSYNIWSFTSVITHIVVPLLAIVDFFVDDYEIIFRKSCVFLSLIPPFAYLIFSASLSIMKIDFGRGYTFPYPFLDFHSNIGTFAFDNKTIPYLGIGYWLIIILLFIVFLGWLFYHLHPHTRKNRK